MEISDKGEWKVEGVFPCCGRMRLCMLGLVFSCGCGSHSAKSVGRLVVLPAGNERLPLLPPMVAYHKFPKRRDPIRHRVWLVVLLVGNESLSLVLPMVACYIFQKECYHGG